MLFLFCSILTFLFLSNLVEHCIVDHYLDCLCEDKEILSTLLLEFTFSYMVPTGSYSYMVEGIEVKVLSANCQGLQDSKNVLMF